HDEYKIHRRSLRSCSTMEAFDADERADPHENGTIWAAALWNLRESLSQNCADWPRLTDLLVLKCLLLIGTDLQGQSIAEIRARRGPFDVGAAALLRADEELFRGAHRDAILGAMSSRGIRTPAWKEVIERSPSGTVARARQPSDGRDRGKCWSHRVA